MRHYGMLLICKPLVVYQLYCMALYHSQMQCNLINAVFPKSKAMAQSKMGKENPGNYYMLGNVSCFCCRLLTFQKFFQEHYQSVKRFESRHSVSLDLGPNCLQRLSADDISQKLLLAKKRVNICIQNRK